jgi:hypothetical protein
MNPLAKLISGQGAPLEPKDELAFQSWVRGTPFFSEYQKRWGEEPDLNTPIYDYRAAYKAGIAPERDPYDENAFHWPSTTPDGTPLKATNHPTAWKQKFVEMHGHDPGPRLNDEDRFSSALRSLMGGR